MSAKALGQVFGYPMEKEHTNTQTITFEMTQLSNICFPLSLLCLLLSLKNCLAFRESHNNLLFILRPILSTTNSSIQNVSFSFWLGGASNTTPMLNCLWMLNDVIELRWGPYDLHALNKYVSAENHRFHSMEFLEYLSSISQLAILHHQILSVSYTIKTHALTQKHTCSVLYNNEIINVL